MRAVHIPLLWRAGSDRVGILILSLSSIVRGIFYAPPVIPEGHRIPAIEGIAPLELWAVVWIAIGIIGIISLAVERLEATAIGLFVSINVAWGLLYIGAWIAGASNRGYITSLSYWVIAAITMWAFGRGRAKQ